VRLNDNAFLFMASDFGLGLGTCGTGLYWST